jgi:DNA-binding beta-propeller fold protein YncE
MLNGGAKSPRFVYFGNWGNDAVTRCPVDQSTGALGSCTFIYGCPADAGCLEIDSLFYEPTSLVFNSAGTVAFIADNDNEEVYTCEVSSNGDFSNCAEITDPYSFDEPFAISLSPDGTIAYVSQYNSDIAMVECKVNGSDLTNCTNSTYDQFAWATNVIYTDNGNKAYVGNYDLHYIYLCDVDPTPGPSYGDLSNCTTTGGYSNFEYPTQIAMNPAGTILYSIWEQDEEITLCNINNSDFSLSCTPVATGLSLSGSYGLAINPAGTFAYISDYDLEQAFYCGINSSNGALENCTQTGSGSFGYGMFINFLY